MTMLRIRNLRLGHATNSSSSHSIVIMKRGHKPLPSNWYLDDDPYGHNQRAPKPEDAYAKSTLFGQNSFILADARSKMLYIATEDRYRYKSWQDMRQDFGEILSDDDLRAAWSGYHDNDDGTDIQSFPREFILSDGIMILGTDGDRDMDLPNTTKLEYMKDLRVKKDGSASIWYSPSTGFKARFSPEPYLKATSPELVDVKITDYCPYGCSFCYQGSTREGAHAPLDLILETADRLAQIGVFEVALGGGEPMMHPDFPAIVKAFHERGITPNVTSFGVEWLKRDDVMSVVGLIGGLGVSVQTPGSVGKIHQIKEALQEVDGGSDVMILPQHAVGTGDLYEITERIHDQYLEPSLLLLGFKNVGRGINGQSHPQSDEDVITAIDNLTRWGDYPGAVSVDTAFLEQYPNVIEKLDVPEHMTSSPEGMFSMYIDLVAGTMGPSSYCPQEACVPLDLDGILDVFARWQPVAPTQTPDEPPASYAPS
jgi:hypothetical protein